MAAADPAPDPDRAPSASQRRDIARAREVLDDTLDDVARWLLGVSGELEPVAKTDGTPVTTADVEVDDRLRERLATAFPTHGLISEEGATRAPHTSWTWVIDPIDGTSNFTHRLPYWCISVALLHEGTPVLGVVDAPVLGRRYHGIHGGGATVTSRTTSLDGGRDHPRRRSLQVRAPVDWRDGRFRHVPVMLTTGTARRARQVGMRLNPRVMGSTALDLALVAEGVAAAAIARTPKVWDVAAGALLVAEAGGCALQLGDDLLLPLTPGVQQLDRSVVVAAGPEDAYVRGLSAALLG